MKNTKKELYNAGRENFFRYIALAEDFEKLKIVNGSLINSLKHILAHVDLIEFGYVDDDSVEDEPVKKPQETGMEVQ